MILSLFSRFHDMGVDVLNDFSVQPLNKEIPLLLLLNYFETLVYSVWFHRFVQMSTMYTLSNKQPCVLSLLSHHPFGHTSLPCRYGLPPLMKSNWKIKDRVLRRRRQQLELLQVTIALHCCKCRKCHSNDQRASTRPRPPRPEMRRTRSWRCLVASRNVVRRIRKPRRPPASTVSTWRSTGDKSVPISCSSSTTRSCAL